MSKINSFLEQAGAVLNRERELRKEQERLHAPDFRFYNSIYQDENSISRCIKTLLDVKGKHGQGTLYMDLFLNILLPEQYARVDRADVEASTVVVEKPTTAGRRIDIYIELGDFGVIAIENKPWADDQENQLKDYADYARAHCGKGGWLLVYLCNWQPSEYSIDSATLEDYERGGNFLRLDFNKLIGWLDECEAQTQPLNIKIFIKELIFLIRERVNREVVRNGMSETVSFIESNNENLEMAFSVSESVAQLKLKLLEQFKKKLAEALDSEGMRLSWNVSDDLNSRYNNFNIELNVTKDDAFTLYFEFYYKGLEGLWWGIRRKSAEFYSETRWAAIKARMDSGFGNSQKSEAWLPWWEWAGDSSRLTEYYDWNTNHLPWIAIRDGAMANEIVEIAKEVKTLFLGIQLLGV